jgi:SnoaL-like domain
MPWFPDFVSAVELARRDTHATGSADPAGQYLRALVVGDVRTLESVWPGSIVIEDPRAGTVSGHQRLRHFVRDNQVWLAERHAATEEVATTRDSSRAVLEVLAQLDDGGRRVAWPLAVVAESRTEVSVLFWSYCSQWPVDGRHHLRQPILDPTGSLPGGVIGRHLAALAAGDTDSIVETFAIGGSLRGPGPADDAYEGAAALRSYYSRCFSAGGGIELQGCRITDDGTRCVFEHNLMRWGRHVLPPQAGLMVFERSRDGLLDAVRVYNDVDPPPDLVT